MPQYLTPGVYVEVVPPKAQPISGVGTTTAAFIGVAENIIASMPIKPGITLEFKSGTITVAAGVVTLAGDKWPALAAGGMIKINDVSYPVEGRQSDTTLKLPANNRPADFSVATTYQLTYPDRYTQAVAKKFVLVTNWSNFVQQFGDIQESNQYLAHAVYGFFNNGGTRCYVARITSLNDFNANLLRELDSNDEIAMVCAPLPPRVDGVDVTSSQLQTVHTLMLAHCELLQDRVAILDSLMTVSSLDTSGIKVPSSQNGFGAFYFPWVKVPNPLGKLGATLDVPTSGHIAGMYARTDTSRGVYKAPANESLLGVVDTTIPLSDGIQSALNPNNVNCIRVFSGTPTVWGARTVAQDPQFRYINVRRFLIFLRKSILNGVRWATFEPNSSGLWQRITRSVSDFLLVQWREGALLGETPQQAFFVRCDATTNPPEVREQGMVITEIGVAIVKPAEFVVFRIQQQTGN